MIKYINKSVCQIPRSEDEQMRKYAWIYILVTLIVLVWAIRYFMNKPVQTEIANAIDYEDVIKASGIIVRDETLYKTETGGSLQSEVFDETRVSRGKKIATVYTDGIDSNLKSELDSINEKIEKLESATSQTQVFANDLASVEAGIKSGIDELVSASVSSDMSSLSVIEQEISSLMSTQRRVSGADTPRQNALNDLYTQKSETEGKINSAKKDIYASSAGVYIAGVDGCEQYMTPGAVINMSVEEFNSLNIPKRSEVKEHYDAGEYVCKTVDNGKWYVCATVDQKDISEFEKGDRVYIRMPELASDEVDGEIENISEESGGKVLVTLSSGHYIKGVYSERCAEIEIILSRYSGLKVPISAVRVEGEDTGVFVNTDGVARFRKIDILYKDDKMAIADISSESGYLKMYDPVIVNGKDIEQGKIIN